MFTQKEIKDRTIWSFLLVGGLVLQLFSVFIQQQLALSFVSIIFTFSLYYFCYKNTHTWLLTLVLTFYSVIIGGFFIVLLSLYMMGAMFRQTRIAEHFDFWPILAGLLSAIYLGFFLFYTYKLRKMNKRVMNLPHH